MLEQRAKIKLILDIKRNRISNQIIQFLNKTILYSDPTKCTIDKIQIAEKQYQNSIVFLKSLSIKIIEYRNVSLQYPNE
jgi:hypothetical protein